MQIYLLIPEYFLWHYTAALRLHINIVSNLLWFAYHFFSVPVLVRTLFAPWRRSHISYHLEFHPKVIAETIVLNSIMRILGFVFRFFVLVFGLTVCVLIALAGVVSFIVWFFLPIIIFLSFIKAVDLLIS